MGFAVDEARPQARRIRQSAEQEKGAPFLWIKGAVELDRLGQDAQIRCQRVSALGWNGIQQDVTEQAANRRGQAKPQPGVVGRLDRCSLQCSDGNRECSEREEKGDQKKEVVKAEESRSANRRDG